MARAAEADLVHRHHEPPCQNELQAEAMLELRPGLSESAAGLFIIAECDGAEPVSRSRRERNVTLGDVVAEALEATNSIADLTLPLGGSESREPLPRIPTTLEQCTVNHQVVIPTGDSAEPS